MVTAHCRGSALLHCDIGLFVYMAFDDERVLMASAMATDYERYKMRVGTFLPRLSPGERE
jgi:hypothetical protein